MSVPNGNTGESRKETRGRPGRYWRGSAIVPNNGDKRPFVNPELVAMQRKMVRALRRAFMSAEGYYVSSTEVLAVCSAVTGKPPDYHRRSLARVMKAAFPHAGRRKTRKAGPVQRRVWTNIRRRPRADRQPL